QRLAVRVSACVLAGLLGPALGAGAQAPAHREPAATPLYVIQPNDMLRIFVYNEPELSGDFLVRPDGRISVPLVQDMPAAGLTPGELGERIEARLAEYIEVPNVTVMIAAIQSYRVYVTGLVASP